MPLSNTYSTVLKSFPVFNQILNYSNLANSLTILLKLFHTFSNDFKENCGLFTRKPPANLLLSLNLNFSRSMLILTIISLCQTLRFPKQSFQEFCQQSTNINAHYFPVSSLSISSVFSRSFFVGDLSQPVPPPPLLEPTALFLLSRRDLCLLSTLSLHFFVLRKRSLTDEHLQGNNYPFFPHISIISENYFYITQNHSFTQFLWTLSTISLNVLHAGFTNKFKEDGRQLTELFSAPTEILARIYFPLPLIYSLSCSTQFFIDPIASEALSISTHLLH